MAGIPITIVRGKTFFKVFGWSSGRRLYRAITNITNTAPCRVTVPDHGVPDGWPVRISDVRGMTAINDDPTRSPNRVPGDGYKMATVVDVDTIEINDFNALSLPAYIGGGVVEYFEPRDITDFQARSQIRDADNNPLLDLTTENGRIILDPVRAKIIMYIDADTTALQSWDSGVYDIEMVKEGFVESLTGVPSSVGVVAEATLIQNVI